MTRRPWKKTLEGSHTFTEKYPHFSLIISFDYSPEERETREQPGCSESLEITSVLLDYPAKIPGLSIELTSLDFLNEFDIDVEGFAWDYIEQQREEQDGPE
jgi:hypothetical protein